MSDSDHAKHEPVTNELSEERLRDLLRSALDQDTRPKGGLLRGVQAKIRQRSRGKFYDEGWSTAEHPPVYTYLLTSALMLGVLLVLYAVLVPTVGEPIPVRNEPAPVHVIPHHKPPEHPP